MQGVGVIRVTRPVVERGSFGLVLGGADPVRTEKSFSGHLDCRRVIHQIGHGLRLGVGAMQTLPHCAQKICLVSRLSRHALHPPQVLRKVVGAAAGAETDFSGATLAAPISTPEFVPAATARRDRPPGGLCNTWPRRPS